MRAVRDGTVRVVVVVPRPKFLIVSGVSVMPINQGPRAPSAYADDNADLPYMRRRERVGA